MNVALLGFGTVGSGVYEIIEKQQERFRALLGREVEVVAILIQDKTKPRVVENGVLVTSDFEEIITLHDVDVVVEAIVGVEPGYTYLRRAIEKGCHVVTANKELFAHKGFELKALAAEHNVNVSFEAAVAGGIPIIGTLKQLLHVNQVLKIEAILNGTSNYILSEIREKERSFVDALNGAKEAGYAEADPTNDVDGFDAFFKIVILAELLYGIRLEWGEIKQKGIRDITLEDIQLTESLGFRLKHIASLEWEDGRLKIGVEPKVVTPDHQLYAVDGVDNAVVINGDLVGELKLQGPGAGKYPTASAVVEDLVNVFSSIQDPVLPKDVQLEKSERTLVHPWLLISQTSVPVVGEVSLDQRIQQNGQLYSVKVVRTTRTEIDRLQLEYKELKAYQISGGTVPELTKASITA
ncbi:homoserine dehydrogenase [Pseudalkalibacillus berkeleyi]|uniref:Homoserine dehydrogenase n=1 Tax=Pseudalkalibacillus berkeleyi TaxID=1069813 RepID=A0ABS9GYS3_9BACL|nr:homoserine dehydrogenase [Pseudalkalibacillus berkeleyi]MCF6136643.1 homoserine dehydrogenase [Pseudalkalibacillus berkeleyi]